MLNQKNIKLALSDLQFFQFLLVLDGCFQK